MGGGGEDTDEITAGFPRRAELRSEQARALACTARLPSEREGTRQGLGFASSDGPRSSVLGPPSPAIRSLRSGGG